MLTSLKQEKFMLLALIAAVAAYPLEHWMLHNGQMVALLAGLALIGFIVVASMRVAHHAEQLAEKVGDPYGTMILTLAAVLVEVVILAIMMSNEPSPTLVRDTIYSAVMLDINGILGLAALMGGIKHGEQSYNDDSARTYSVMILTAMGVSMVVPEFIPEADWKIYSAFTIGAMVVLYTLFLRMQVGPHSYFFSYSYPEKRRKTLPEEQAPPVNLAYAIGTLVFGVVVIGALAGFALSGVQSVSRMAVGKMAPVGKSAEFFGFFAVAGHTSSFIGPAVYGWIAADAAIIFATRGLDALAAEQAGLRVAVISIIVFLAIGLVLLLWCTRKEAL